MQISGQNIDATETPGTWMQLNIQEHTINLFIFDCER